MSWVSTHLTTVRAIFTLLYSLLLLSAFSVSSHHRLFMGHLVSNRLGTVISWVRIRCDYQLKPTSNTLCTFSLYKLVIPSDIDTGGYTFQVHEALVRLCLIPKGILCASGWSAMPLTDWDKLGVRLGWNCTTSKETLISDHKHLNFLAHISFPAMLFCQN